MAHQHHAFQDCLEQVLAPALRPDDIAVMDNLPAYKGSAIQKLIKAAGASLRYLPPHSPDFNLIKNAFSNLKAILCEAAAYTIGDLWTVSGAALPSFTQRDCAAYFTATGYELE